MAILAQPQPVACCYIMSYAEYVYIENKKYQCEVYCSEDNRYMAVILERDIQRGRAAWENWCTQAQALLRNGKSAIEINSNTLSIKRTDEALAVRYSLYVLARKVPGEGVEVRVAPWGAVKILEGPESDPHNLTPPDVIELESEVWLRVASGITKWDQENQAGHISAMGERDNLSNILPLHDAH